MNWQPPPDRYGTGHPARRSPRLSGWAIAGIVLATVVGLCGLAFLLMIILVGVAMNSYGSNK